MCLMTTVTAKDFCVLWNGDAHQWPDYVRKVRLQYEKTALEKRYLLGPELVSRLTDRAWEACFEIDHGRLQGQHGAKFLLTHLRDRLCRAPVPDAGARLEDLLIRLRRTPGTPFSQWAHQVRETYRRLQRALVRARKEYDEKRGKAADRLLLFPSTRPRRASMETQSEPEPPSADTSRDIGSPAKSTRSAPADGQHDEAGDLEGEIHEMTWEGEDGKWTEADWQKWREMESKDKPQAPDPDDLPWDELEVDTMEVLPDEVLGWLLLRRAGLPASSRLSVQAAIGNSLRFTEVERALRDQEEELLQAETRASERRGPQKRSYWVEQEQEWGLLDMHPDSSDETPVHWIGKELPAEVYALSAAGSAGELDAESGGDAWWSSTATWDEPTWWSSPTWWTEEWSEPELTSEEQKQVDEAYAAYEDKVRTFVQARTLMKDKTRNRGFYQAAKGKGKASKGKGKGKGPTPTLAAASPTFMAVKGSKGKAKGPNYTGCFICGSRDHGYQSCPQRTRGPGKGCPSSSGQAMVVISGWEVPDLPEEDYEDGHGYESYTDEVETVHAEAWTVQEAGHRCYAVLDSGATETVTSLTALTEIMNYRKELFGDEDVKVYPADGKSFRFGNGRTMLASSFVEIPQFLNGQKVWLGAYTLDTEDAFVPMLIGMRTLQKLEAVVDFRSRLAIFPTLSPDMITLHQCPRTGHLMIDLSADWARTSAYMALPADSGVQEGPVEFEPAQVATDGHVGVAGQMGEDARAPAARIKRLLASRPSENPESNGHGPGQQADQQGRSERPAGNFVIMQYFGQQEGEGQGEEGEQVERGSDLRHGPEGGDPRWEGGPCAGKHQPAPMGRGSPSGKNGWAKWTTCSVCRLRLEYIPAFGAHGRYRSAGPLGQDVKDQLVEKPNEIASNPATLSTTTVALDGAERSLMKRLETIRKQKEVNSKSKSTTAATKKMQKRNTEMTAEELEEHESLAKLEQTEKEELDEWDKVQK